jgi:hypothetical protein
MIECKDGTTKIEGMGLDILNEYTNITRGIYKNFSKSGSPEFTKELLLECFNLATMSDEEREAQAAEAKNGVRELLKKIEALLDE